MLSSLKAGDPVWHYGLQATGAGSTWAERTVKRVTASAVELTNGKTYRITDGQRIHSESFMPDMIAVKPQLAA